MIDHYVTAARGAKAAVAQLAAVKLIQIMHALADFHSLGFPQREDADRRGAITPALITMTVTHVNRFTGCLDFHCSAIASACMCISHDFLVRIWMPGSQEESHQKPESNPCTKGIDNASDF